MSQEKLLKNANPTIDMHVPVNNRANVQVEPRVVEDEESLEHDKGHVEAADHSLQWVVARRPRLFLDNCDQLEWEEGQIANGKEDRPNAQDGARMTLWTWWRTRMIQSDPLNGSASWRAKFWTNKQIGPLTTTFCYVSPKMGLAKTWTNNQIESLSGDPLSGLHYSSIMSTYTTKEPS